MHLKSQAMNALHLLIVDAATLRRVLYRYGEAFVPQNTDHLVADTRAVQEIVIVVVDVVSA
eukprot:COSAG01_NODE_41551_length_450_cov_0.672365_1_plen_60_part_10